VNGLIPREGWSDVVFTVWWLRLLAEADAFVAKVEADAFV
jgi:hypothetical protein